MQAFGATARAVLLCATCVVLATCGSYRGVQEFEIYRSGFEKTYGTSTAIVDQLAVQERELFRRHSRQWRIDPANPKFDPRLVRYYTDLGDPPGAAAFRRALDTVKAYNDLLYGLSSGQTAETLVAKMGTLNSKINEAGAEAGALVGFAGGAGQMQLSALAVALDGAFARFAPFARVALTIRSREEFRRYAIEYYPAVQAILVELRQGAVVIFPTLTFATRGRWLKEGGQLTAAEVAKLEAYRQLLADWVILIDGTINALEQVKIAVEAPPTIVGTVTGLTATAVELEAASQAARKHLAEISAK